MKKEADIRYPSSAYLFQFCRRVLDHKFGGIRVIDQDVGQILGFDPADCSHWKKGKKNVRSIQAMKAIADHLGVDERLVVDVASGEMDDAEAFFEYKGYGPFQVDGKFIDAARKDYYRKHAANWTKDKEQEFRQVFDLKESEIDRLVKEIHEKINFAEAPLYLPEVGQAYSQIKIIQENEALAEGEEASIDISESNEGIAIKVKTGKEMRPYLRFAVSKAIGRHLLKTLKSAENNDGLEKHNEQLQDIRENIFAAKLLTPAPLIRKEMANLNPAKDIITQLAEVFWVSKTFINRRLKEILVETGPSL